MREPREARRHRVRADLGFAVVQSTIALGLLGGGVFGLTAIGRAAIGEAQRVACATDRQVVRTAVETYRILEDAVTIPATGSGVDRFELTIVAAGLLTEQSQLHDVTEDGRVVAADSRC
jgi:hypothetical protein